MSAADIANVVFGKPSTAVAVVPAHTPHTNPDRKIEPLHSVITSMTGAGTEFKLQTIKTKETAISFHFEMRYTTDSSSLMISKLSIHDDIIRKYHIKHTGQLAFCMLLVELAKKKLITEKTPVIVQLLSASAGTPSLIGRGMDDQVPPKLVDYFFSIGFAMVVQGRSVLVWNDQYRESRNVKLVGSVKMITERCVEAAKKHDIIPTGYVTGAPKRRQPVPGAGVAVDDVFDDDDDDDDGGHKEDMKDMKRPQLLPELTPSIADYTYTQSKHTGAARTAAPPPNKDELTEKLKAAQAYQQKEFSEPEYQWAAYLGDKDETLLHDLSNETVFEGKTVRTLTNDQKASLAKVTGVWVSKYESEKDKKLAAAYGDLVEGIKTGNLPALLSPAAAAKRVDMARDAETNIWSLKRQVRGWTKDNDCDEVGSKYEPETDTGVVKDEGRQRWYIGFFGGGWRNVFKKKIHDDKYESLLSKDTQTESRHYKYMIAVHGVIGFPQMVAACLEDAGKSDILTVIPMLRHPTGELSEQRIPTLEQLCTNGVKFTKHAEQLLAFRLRNVIRESHGTLGYTHNNITSTSVRVDPSDQLFVYLDRARWVYPVTEVKTKTNVKSFDIGGKAETDPYAFDYYSAIRMFEKLGMLDAAAVLAQIHPWPSENEVGPGLEDYYKGQQAVWETAFNKRIALIA